MRKLILIALLVTNIQAFCQKGHSTFVKKYSKYTTYVDEVKSLEYEGTIIVKFSNGFVFLTNLNNSTTMKFEQVSSVSQGKVGGKDLQMISCTQSDCQRVVFVISSDGRLCISLTPQIAKLVELGEVPNNPEENYIEFLKH